MFRFLLSLSLLATSAFAENTTLNVITYNVGLLSTALTGDLVAEVAGRAEKLPAAIAKLATDKKADVVALQEVWSPKHAAAIRTKLEDAGYEVYRSTPETGAFVLGSGLLLAIRKATLKFESKPKTIGYKHMAALERASTSKGYVIVTVSVRGNERVRFELVTGHYQVLTVDPKTGKITNAEEGSANAMQLLQTIERAEERSNDGRTPVLLAADFNVGPGLGEENYRLLEKNYGYSNALLTTHPIAKQDKNAPLVSWDRSNPLIKSGKYANDPSAPIDHVLTKNGKGGTFTAKDCTIEMKEFDAKLKVPLSDHYAVACELELAE